MKRVHVFGIGSLSGDDQAGWLVVDALRALGLERDAPLVLDKLDRPGASLLTRLEGADHVILIDAMRGGGAPGDIRRLDPSDWASAAADVSSHGFGLAAALALADALGGLPARVELYGIEIGAAQPGETVSAPVHAAAATLGRQLADALRSGVGTFAHEVFRV